MSKTVAFDRSESRRDACDTAGQRPALRGARVCRAVSHAFRLPLEFARTSCPRSDRLLSHVGEHRATVLMG